MCQLFCFLFLAMLHHGMAACDPRSGPSGTVNCIQIPRYNYQWQWGTCITDAYMKQKSSHQHQCIDRSRTYCYYQCMLEVHNKNSGPVTNDCSCTPSQTTIHPPITAISPTTLLPLECYSPSGESCDWYNNCLERKYPCEATSNAYAIKYAEMICRLYDEKKYLFTEKGQRWMDGVRKCLQVALVPLLRPWRKPSCQEIRKEAFASHAPCYLNPDRGVPSICDLGCFVYFKILFVIWNSFRDWDIAWESLKGFWNIEMKCGLKCVRLVLAARRPVLVITKLAIKRFKRRKRRSSDPIPESDARSRFANQLGSAIAKSMNWNKEVMDWLAFPDDNIAANITTDSFNITMVLADKKALGIVNSSASVDLNRTSATLASAIKEGKLPLQVNGFNVWLESIASCSDKSCKQTQTLAVSDNPPNWNRSTTEVSPVSDKSPTWHKSTTEVSPVSDKPPNWHSSTAEVFPGALKILGMTAIALMLMNKR